MLRIAACSREPSGAGYTREVFLALTAISSRGRTDSNLESVRALDYLYAANPVGRLQALTWACGRSPPCTPAQFEQRFGHTVQEYAATLPENLSKTVLDERGTASTERALDKPNRVRILLNTRAVTKLAHRDRVTGK